MYALQQAISLLICLGAGVISGSALAEDAQRINSLSGEPIAERRPFIRTYHGVTLSDDYAWLKAPNWRQALSDPTLLPTDIKAYLNAENNYFNDKMRPTLPLQRELFQELKGRKTLEDSTVPVIDGAYAYFSRYLANRDYRLFYRRPLKAFGNQRELFSLEPHPADQLLLDVNLLARRKPGFNLGAVKHSFNHRFLAYSFDSDGAEHYQIRIRDLATGNILSDDLHDTDGNFVWLLDASGFFYVKLDSNSRARSIWLHRIGAKQVDDIQVFTAPRETGFSASVWLTLDRRFFAIGIGDYHTGEIYLIDAQKPLDKPRLVARREADLQYSISVYNDRVYILTNADGANDFKIVSAPLKTPQRNYWRDVIPHQAGRMIVSIATVRDYLIRRVRKNGREQLVFRHLADGAEHTLSVNEEAYTLNFSSGHQFNTDVIRIVYSSLKTPQRIYDYNIKTHKLVLRKKQGIPSGFTSKDYRLHRWFATAQDGDQVPLTVLFNKNTKLDGSAPVFIMGYGAYGRSLHPYFRENIFSLVNRGFVFVLAHVRGGMEKGYDWYKNGRLDKKTNTFNDFIAVEKFLIKNRIGSAGKIIAYGASAGGMIMGVIANQDDGLLCGIVTDVPFVDVLNTMLDDSLPLTPSEWPEWGNPVKNPEDFNLIRSYSPYDNVRKKAYPHMMVLASVSDSRVTYWEAAKWIAKLRAMRTNHNVLMLRTDMSAGHSGATGRFSGLAGVAMIYAFAIKAVNGKRCLSHSQ